MKIKEYFITYDKDKIIWGTGEDIQASKLDATTNVIDYFLIEPEKCIANYRISLSEKSRELIIALVRSELISFQKFKTIKCSEKLYKYIRNNGAEDFTDWKIKNNKADLK